MSLSQILRLVRIDRLLAAAALALCGLAFLPLATLAQDEVDDVSSGLVGLSLPLGARSVGLGRAVAAATGELQALPYNPAAIVGLERGEVTFSRFESAELADINANYLAGGAVTRWGTLALHAVYVDYGEIPVTEASPDPVGTIDVSDWALGVSFGRRVYHDRLAGAATATWLSSNFDATDASGPAFDAGLVYTPRAALPVSLGVALRNLGPDLEFGDDSEDSGDGTRAAQPLPSRVRVGANLHPGSVLGLPEGYAVEVAFDIEGDLRDVGNLSQHAGAALTIHDVVAVRGGFLLLDNPFTEDGSERNTGGTLGVGVRFGDFEADLAREISVSELGDETHFSVGWLF